MELKLALLFAASLGAGFCVQAQPATGRPQWPDTPQAQVFRKRVIDLAILYGESSGLDEDGFTIRARQVEALAPPCKTVEVDISLGPSAVRHDSFQVCAKPK
ncbi:MAG: hypothetical protein ABI907_09440 [Ramlibacter sp.]